MVLSTNFYGLLYCYIYCFILLFYFTFLFHCFISRFISLFYLNFIVIFILLLYFYCLIFHFSSSILDIVRQILISILGQRFGKCGVLVKWRVRDSSLRNSGNFVKIFRPKRGWTFMVQRMRVFWFWWYKFEVFVVEVLLFYADQFSFRRRREESFGDFFYAFVIHLTFQLLITLTFVRHLRKGRLRITRPYRCCFWSFGVRIEC